jgi:ribosomal protein S18 acetylase RimI-like enzyme
MDLHDDPLIVWARQDGRPGVRAWSAPGAVAVACPDLSRRDRLAVHGDPDAVAGLLTREVLPRVGPTYRPLGDETLIAALADRVPQVRMAGRFGWMDVTAPVTPGRGEWLDDDAAVGRLLEVAFPDSYARPGGSGVRRWAGIRDGGDLLATAAEAWSSADIGFIAGVTTHPAARGRGLAAALCGFVTDELLRDRRRVALFVDHWNTAALRTYERLGFTLRRLGVAELVRASGQPASGQPALGPRSVSR